MGPTFTNNVKVGQPPSRCGGWSFDGALQSAASLTTNYGCDNWRRSCAGRVFNYGGLCHSCLSGTQVSRVKTWYAITWGRPSLDCLPRFASPRGTVSSLRSPTRPS